MFTRNDWTLFRQLETLGQKAGVARDKIPRLVAKELTDNALDSGGSCRYGLLKGGGFFVEDDGGGIPGTDNEIAAVFSVARPLTSTKLLRLPTRGALGNGLRVVTGAVLASGGRLAVSTGGRRLRLVPQDDGSTSVARVGDYERKGTRIEVTLGSTLPLGANVFEWAKRAVLLARGGSTYAGRSSPFWYDADGFFELCQSAGERTARDLLSELEGCYDSASRITAPYKGRPASSLTRMEAEPLLSEARARARPVKPKRLGYVGDVHGLPAAYAQRKGVFTVAPARGTLRAELPFVLEAWAMVAEKPTVLVHINRTPITADINAWREKNELNVVGCGLGFGVPVGRRAAAVYLNVQTPYLPITTDGKEPDLARLEESVIDVVSKVTRKAKREARAVGPNGRPETQKDVILAALPGAIEKASGGGKYRYSLRQLFYAVRPTLLSRFSQEPDYNTFTRVITVHEARIGRDLPGVYRDARGTLYHPHTRQEIPLGTLAVESYARPAWTFNKILYCEKEGFFPILRDAQWPERHDCALLTAKGFASRAARDVLDLLGDSGEEITVFCIHDADGSGTQIYEALQKGTLARPERQVKIVNLGLEPEEALAMGLEPERVERKDERTVAVASYVEPEWREWLQEKRVELNAMTTPEFLAWLDRKFALHERGKLVPPDAVLNERLEREVRERLRQQITERVLAEARVNEQAEDAFRRVAPEIEKKAGTLAEHVRVELKGAPANHWTAPVASVAEKLVESEPAPSSGAPPPSPS